MTLIFATNNQHKVDEVRTVLPSHFDILTSQQAGIGIDIPEPHDTLEENAKEKPSPFTTWQTQPASAKTQDWRYFL